MTMKKRKKMMKKETMTHNNIINSSNESEARTIEREIYWFVGFLNNYLLK